MKNFYSFLIILIMIFQGCKKEDNTVPNLDELGIVGDGVDFWTPQDSIVITDYYSQLDTVIADRKLIQHIYYEISENEVATVEWRINGEKQGDVVENKFWIGSKQKWKVVSTLTCDISNVRSNLEIEAIVSFSDKKVRRFKVIPTVKIKKVVSDAYGFTFGTKRTEMNDFITQDFSPSLSLSNYLFDSNYHQPFIYFGFSEGKLNKLYSVYDRSLYIDDIIKKTQPPNIIIFDGNLVENSQEWIHGSLKIKVFNATLNQIFNTSMENRNIEMAFLTIEKK
jgi:hypothetical protein